MRTVELAKVAAAAEALRLRRIARRQGIRVAFGAGAGLFGTIALLVLHVVGWHALQPMLTPLQASLVVLAVDVVLAAVFGFMASRDVPDAVEAEAKAIREQAVIELKQSLTVMGMVAGVTGMAVRTGAREGVRRGLVSALTDMAMRLVRRAA
jgi:hypothetical protein